GQGQRRVRGCRGCRACRTPAGIGAAAPAGIVGTGHAPRKENVMSAPAGSGPPPATDAPRPPLPPFDHDSAVVKIRLAEDAWNSRNPEAVSRAYSPDSRWRNRDLFVNGRDEIVAFL